MSRSLLYIIIKQCKNVCLGPPLSNRPNSRLPTWTLALALLFSTTNDLRTLTQKVPLDSKAQKFEGAKGSRLVQKCKRCPSGSKVQRAPPLVQKCNDWTGERATGEQVSRGFYWLFLWFRNLKRKRFPPLVQKCKGSSFGSKLQRIPLVQKCKGFSLWFESGKGSCSKGHSLFVTKAYRVPLVRKGT
jgi:hypothetical protein